MKKSSFLKSLFKLFNYSKSFKIGFIFIVVFSILAAIFSVLTPYLLGLVTNSLFDSITKKTSVDFNYIYKLMIVLGILYLIYSLFIYLKSFISAKISQNLCYNFRKDVVYKINEIPIKEVEKRKKGDIISVIVNDIEKVNDFFTESIPELIYHFVLMIGIIFMMLYISIKLSLIAFLSIPIIFILLALIVKKSQKYFELNQSTLGSVNAFVEESITNELIIKSFNKEEYFDECFKEENEKLREYNFKANLYSGILHPLIKFINNLSYVAIISFGAYFVIKGSLKVGMIQAFVRYMQDFSRPLGMLGEIIGSLQTTVASTNRIFTILETNNEQNGKIKEINNPKLIEIKNVDFAYDEKNPILKNINLDIKRGEQVAIVGETGSGKTTLINLLMHFYNVNQGEILIDGININDIDKYALREKISMVLQDSWIIEDSLKENIIFGGEYNDNKINNVIKEANIKHIIESLPNGLDFELNEESDNISEGEKQLITIARALIREPKVLILDEATSNVDSRIEYLINNSMKKLMENRTSIVIAHRLSTIIQSDKIVLIDKGEIKEVGTHKELIKKKGYYYKLYNSQFENS